LAHFRKNKVMKIEERLISIVDLELDQENYRFSFTNSQKEAIDVMVGSKKTKITSLAKSIAELGSLNPLASIGVYPSQKTKGKYIVIEGNRRTTCLKLILNPEIIKNSNLGQAYRVFNELHNQMNPDFITEIKCIVFNNREEGLGFLNLRHRGEQGGMGRIDWDAKMAERYDEINKDKPSLYWQAVRLISSHPDSPEKEELEKILDKVSKTNFDRLIGNKNIHKLLNIEIHDRRIFTNSDKDELFSAVMEIMRFLSNSKVSDIYTDKDIQKYVQTSFPKELKPKSPSKDDTAWHFPSHDDEIVPAPRAITPSDPPKTSTKQRRSVNLFNKKSPGGNINISTHRISIIYNELRNLNLDRHLNATSILIRVFAELSIDRYMETFDMLNGRHSGTKVNKNLAQKGILVLHRMKQKKQADSGICEGFEFALKKKDGILSVDELNALVHNHRINPNRKDLEDLWEATGDFFDKLWSAIIEEEKKKS